MPPPHRTYTGSEVRALADTPSLTLPALPEFPLVSHSPLTLMLPPLLSLLSSLYPTSFVSICLCVLFSLFTPRPMSPAVAPPLGSFIALPSLPPSLPQLLSLFCSPSSFVCLQSSSSSFQYPNPTFMHFVSFLPSRPFSRPYRPWLPLPLWVSPTVSHLLSLVPFLTVLSFISPSSSLTFSWLLSFPFPPPPPPTSSSGPADESQCGASQLRTQIPTPPVQAPGPGMDKHEAGCEQMSNLFIPFSFSR